jgi:hypothetical protein
MSQTGLHLDHVPASCMLAAGRTLPAGHDDMINVGRLQPDMILISQKQKRIGLLELCRPMDESPTQLQAAVDRKLQTYAPLKVALQRYPASGWTVEILPWVAGVRGLLNPSVFTPIFKFLSIPKSQHTALLEETALESAKAFYFLHQTRRAAVQRFTLKTLFQGASLPTTLVRVATVNGNVDQLKSMWKPEKKWKQMATSMHERR